jgi:16S rRNA (adenine1518-N6/adenine1519-N6)-dimethyltransferase
VIPATPAEIRTVLSDRGLAPRKRFGQHVLADANLRDAVVREAGVGPGDLVIEVGPGLGTLTRGLLDAGAEVVAAEVDRGLCEFLAEALGGEERFMLFTGDALTRGELRGDLLAAVRERRGGRRLLVVSNLPYSVATPLFSFLALLPDAPDSVTAMVQREVARRMTAAPGSGDYGPLSILLNLRGEVRIVREVGGRVFFPSAPVQSALVRFVPGPGDLERLRAADRLARGVFQHRRKALGSALRAAGHEPDRVREALLALGLDAGRRPETLVPADFPALAALLLPPVR